MTKIRRKIFASELFSTQALINPIKTLYLLNFFMKTEDVSLFKLVFVMSSFIFELPSGYFSDLKGNKHALILSRICIAISMLIYCMHSTFFGFFIANMLLGFADAWESGAKDTYYLEVCTTNNLDYKKIKIICRKYTYAINLVLSLLSSIIFEISIYFPMSLTAFFYILSSLILLYMPNDEIRKSTQKKDSSKKAKDFTSLSWFVLKKMISSKKLMYKVIFNTLCVTVLISNFDFYSLKFEQVGIPVLMIGAIYSTFKIMNIFGVKIYEKTHDTAISYVVLFFEPLSFLMISCNSMLPVLAAVVIQEVSFAFYNIDLDIEVVNSIDDLTISSYYQSMISFLITIIRVVITFIITLTLKIMNLKMVYLLFAILTFSIAAIYVIITYDENMI